MWFAKQVLYFISKSRCRIEKNNNIADLNVSIKEISDIIHILHANKASEPDVISHKMLKLCPSKIALPLQVIFNKSLQQSKYPTNWKLDHVIQYLTRGSVGWALCRSPFILLWGNLIHNFPYMRQFQP